MHSIFRIVLRVLAEAQSKAILLRGAERPSAKSAATPRPLHARRAAVVCVKCQTPIYDGTAY